MRRQFKILTWAFLFVFLLSLPLFVNAQTSPTKVGAEAAITLSQAAVEKTFGEAQFNDVALYFDTTGNITVYAVEFVSPSDQTSITAIASARRDDVPVTMMWRGIPKHKDPVVLSNAAKIISDELGVNVTFPEYVIWLDIYEVWAVYPETNPQTGGLILCNLYTGRIANFDDIETKWHTREQNIHSMLQSKTTGPLMEALRPYSNIYEQQAAASRQRAEYIEALWNDADVLLAKSSPNLFKSAITPLTNIYDGTIDSEERTEAAAENTITVTYPNSAGITWQRNKDYTIRWTVSGSVGPTVKIELYKGGASALTIVSSVSSTQGQFVFWVPANQTLASDYRIKITSTNYSSISDMSDNYFTIAAYIVPPAHSTRYIPDVPNIDQGPTPDCAVVATMDVLLYWDTRGYHRLIDGGDLAQARADLRQAMNYDPSRGVFDQDQEPGVRAFTNDALYNNQYDFTISFVSRPTYANFTAEIDAGRPSVVVLHSYADDPNNPTDQGYVNHSTCGVGYFTGNLFQGHTSTQWAIIHDNWGGGDFTNPYTVDDEPYIDFTRVSNLGALNRIQPFPIGTVVTYPSVAGITWQAGTSQLITWKDFPGSYVKIELYKGSSLNRSITSSTSNNGSYPWTVPSDQTTDSDFRIKITSTSDSSKYDYSDNYFQINAAPNPPTNLSASDGTYTDKVRVSWSAPSSGPSPTGYKIFQNTSNSSSGASQIGTSSASPYDDTGGSAGVTYWYWAKAYNSAGNSGFSNGDSGYLRISLPGSFTLTATPACSGTSPQIRLNWAVSSGAQTYDVYRNGSLYYSDLTGNQFINTLVTAGTSYTYYVKAKNSTGSTNSNTVSATAPRNCVR